MTYRITVRSNPRILLMFLIILALPAGGVVSLFFLPLFVGIVVTGLGCYLAYHLGKYTLSSLRSRVTTNENGVTFALGFKDNPEMRWEDIAAAGTYVEGREKAKLFVYEEANDSLITVPPDYEGYEGLVDEVRSHTDFEEVELNESETLADYLKKRLNLDDHEDDVETAASDADDSAD